MEREAHCDLDLYYMNLALKQAQIASSMGEIPVGAVLVKGDKVISAAFNRREIDRNALAHAEILAIDAACKSLVGWRLFGCTLYVTLEPCIMCAGAILNSRIERVVFGARDLKAGAFGSVADFTLFQNYSSPVILPGVCEEESSRLLTEFFQALREKKS